MVPITGTATPPSTSTDREAVVMAEHLARLSVVVDEVRRLRLAPSTHSPDHGEMSVRYSAGSPFDDHTTSAGQCLACGAWIVRTDFVTSRDTEDRLMTDKELDRLQAIDDRYRRLEAV